MKPIAYRFQIKSGEVWQTYHASNLPKNVILSNVVPLFEKPVFDQAFLRTAFENSLNFNEFYSQLSEIQIVDQEPGDIVNRLLARAAIRRQISSRKSVELNEKDRIADLLEEAAQEIMKLRGK